MDLILFYFNIVPIGLLFTQKQKIHFYPAKIPEQGYAMLYIMDFINKYTFIYIYFIYLCNKYTVVYMYMSVFKACIVSGSLTR